MKKRPAEFWYTGDYYRAVDLQKCCAATRGIWRDALDAMVNEQIKGKIRGTREELCQLLRCTPEEFQRFLDDNKAHKFANIYIRAKNNKQTKDIKNVTVTVCYEIVTIICRRIYREQKEREATKKRVSEHRKRKKRKCNVNVTSPSSYSSSYSCNNTVTLMNPTLQECYDAAILIGVTEQQAKAFFDHYKSQGWKWGNGQPMTPPLQNCLSRWRNNAYKFESINHGNTRTKNAKSTSQRADNRRHSYAEQKSEIGETIE